MIGWDYVVTKFVKTCKKLIILQKINFTVNNKRQSDYRVAISHIKVTKDKGLDMEIMALFYLRNNCTLCFLNNLWITVVYFDQ